MTTIRAACLLLCLAVPAWVAATTPPTSPPTTPAVTRPLDLSDLAAPVFANFSARDGLPEQVMVDVRTDRDGFVWAASPQGVSRYDGRRWTASDDPAMAHPANNLYVDGAGTLWAGFRNHGLARYDGQRWHVENAASGLPFEQIRRFVETVDARGQRSLWALTWDYHVMQRRDGRWIKDPGDASLPDSMILSMAQTTGIGGVRRQWLGSGSHGLWYRDEGSRDWTQWHARDIDAAQIESLLVTRDGDGPPLAGHVGARVVTRPLPPRRRSDALPLLLSQPVQCGLHCRVFVAQSEARPIATNSCHGSTNVTISPFSLNRCCAVTA